MIGQTHCRGITVLLSFDTRLPFDLLPEWHDVRALPDRRAAAGSARSRRARAADPRRHGGRLPRWRGIGAMPRKPDFDGIRVYLHGLPPNPTVAEVAAAAWGVAGRGDDRPRARDRLRAAVHPAEPLPAGPRRAAGGAAPPAHGHDVLRLRCPPQPDRRLVDPHPPARLLGARPPGVHARGGGPHAHAGAGAGVGLRRPRACCARAWPPTSTSSTRTGSARRCRRWSTTCRGREAPLAARRGLQGHGRRRRGHHPRRRDDRRPARATGAWAAARPDAQRIQSIRATRWWIIHVPSRRTISST